MYFFLNLLLYSGAWFKQTLCIVMMNEGGSTKIIIFMRFGAGFLLLGRGHTCHIVKMHYTFKNSLLYSKAEIRQTMFIVMMTKEESSKIVNFMTAWAEVFMLQFCYINHIVKMHYFF